jgi:ABC-type Zn2+ transport system substrate-binding protein/surface adhesin
VSSLSADGQVVRCHVLGPIAPLLTALAGANVTELLSREPSLEELFLAQYGDHHDDHQAHHDDHQAHHDDHDDHQDDALTEPAS